MFLGQFSKEEQAIFLNLAYTMMYADHEVKDDEREKFQLYQTEVEADITKAEVVDFVAELAKFQNLDITKKKMLLFELLGIAFADAEYAEDERVLMEQAAAFLSVSPVDMERMMTLVQDLAHIYQEVHEVIMR